MPDTNLTPKQTAQLDVILRNESDVAYKRRVRTMLRYLELEPGLTLLDCGTGMGFYLKTISELYPNQCQLYGIDFEDKVLRYAIGHLAGKATVSRGDIHKLPFGDAVFDRVLMSEVLEHLADDAGALQQVRRAMRPGGILALTVPHKHYPYWYDPINRVAEDVFRCPIRTGPFAGIWANHERLYDRDEVAQVVADAGFELLEVQELTHYCFPATQTIVYTFGKGLIDHNLLPAFLAKSTHRFQGQENNASRLNPINWVLGVFNWVDSFNASDTLYDRVHTFVNIAIKARKVD